MFSSTRPLQPRLAVRWASTAARPDLLSLLPKKRTFNKILFDNNSSLSYKKMMPILQTVYSNLATPENITLPKNVQPSDLMTFKNVLATIRKTTNTINNHLVALENELTEQAAELGDNDAIAILAFETVEKKLRGDPTVSKEDFQYANELIKKLTDLQHPLVFKMAGDLAFKRGYYNQAEPYWVQFTQLEPDTVAASQVYSNLGLYHFSYAQTPDLGLARTYFEKSIRVGELDEFTIKAHYYLGQLYVDTNPLSSRYHFEISASRGLKESFSSLGFLEMNVFQNYHTSIEWFKLGVESSNDIACMIGQFDCYLKMKDYKSAYAILTQIKDVQEKIAKVRRERRKVPKEIEESMAVTEGLLRVFFETRTGELAQLATMIA
ncbi:HCP-like protein [Suhomyces tanzawaensis NRRL Y-17324]|uniref:HCP-like protein n=1 Tax=Suhomyces tanzawaensis NRRL Y-17324 TaxID=984487 RepID=A0A1E4SH66_9ASCO|nr:HCP-like protein [Suhomyces tanzawaensis NRRL Y-17324]ODV78762.1 HCP-like protein [Suhomyces tanzawaensis NRRL Y-17324]